MLSSSPVSLGLTRKLKAFAKRKFNEHPLVDAINTFSLGDFFHWDKARREAVIRKPVRQKINYQFRQDPSGEEHRTFKMLRGEVVEHTKIEVGFTPHFAKVRRHLYHYEEKYFSIQLRMLRVENKLIADNMLAPFLWFISWLYILSYWFVREPLKNLYNKIDRHKVQFERLAEMDVALEQEEKLRQSIGDSDGPKTPDYIHERIPIKEAGRVNKEPQFFDHINSIENLSEKDIKASRIFAQQQDLRKMRLLTEEERSIMTKIE